MSTSTAWRSENLNPYGEIEFLSNLTVARDKMMVNLPQFGGEIWMTQIE